MKITSSHTAVVTGAGSGIGRSLALELAKTGCGIALVDINSEQLAETAAMLQASGIEFSSHVVNVADRNAVQDLADTVVATHGGVNVLFNNAGVTLIDSVEKVKYDDFEWIMSINFWGVVHGCKAFLPYLRQAEAAHIVNVSSLFGLMSLPLQSAYNASKFAVRGFSEALKMEMAGSGVGVSCVHPGGIKTSIAANSRIGEQALSGSKEQLFADFDKAAITTPQRAAQIILKGVERGKRRIIVGRDARIMDWIVRHFPGSYEKIMGLEKGVLKRRKLLDESGT